MRDNRGVRKWSAWLAVLGVVLLAVAIATGTSRARAPDRRAHPDARRILASLRLPPGATEVSADPSSARVLGAPPARPLVPRLVDLHEFWRVPGEPAQVLTWIEAHAPRGAHQDMGGASSPEAGGSGATTIGTAWAGFGFADIPRALGDRELIVTVARARGGGTALRADAQSAPVAHRTTAERIPAGITAIAISERRLSGTSAPAGTVTKLARVRRIVALVNALPLGPSGPIACPADMGPFVTLSFSSAGRPVATAVADGSGCGFVSLSIRDRREPILAGGAGLLRKLSSLLGTSF